VTFSVEAYHTANTGGDDFVFAYSTNGVNYTNMLTVTKTADDDTPQTFSMPAGLSGTVYVRVMDTYRDWSRNTTFLDTIYVDDMFIVSVGGVAGGSSQSMAALAAGSIAPLAAKGSIVAAARIESPSSVRRAAALDELFAADDAVYNSIDSAAAHPFVGSALIAPRERSSGDTVLEDLQTGLLDDQLVDDLATALI
jgi:hypothetical protein